MRRWCLFWSGAVSACLSAVAAGQPENDGCAGAIDVSGESFPYRTPGVSVSAATPGAEVAMGCATGGRTVWYKVVPALAGDLTVSTCLADVPECTVADTVVTLYRSSGASCGLLTVIGCSDDACGLRSRVSATVVAGTTYFIQVGKFGTAAPPAGADVVQIEVTAPLPLPPDRWVEQDDAGDLVGTAQTPDGQGTLGSIGGRLEGAEADLYRIEVCDAAIFSAAVVADPLFDSQLFLFDLEGYGVVFSDDGDGTLHSRITSALLPGNGGYYLGISEYDRDPLMNDGLEIWADGPSVVERAPDGPGADSPLAEWSVGGFEGARYVIELTGACYPVVGTCWGACPADYDQNGGIDGQDVEAFFEDWEPGESCADTNRDGSVDGSDVETFFVVWVAGGC